LVSVVLPVRNGEAYVSYAIESIVSQTFDDFELLVFDDGSTDRTPQILNELAQRDSRMRVVHTEPRGLVRTLNEAFSQAGGKYIARMDADDIAVAERLQVQVSALECDSRLGLVGAAIRVISDGLDRGYIVRYPRADAEIRRRLALGSTFAHPVVMLRKSVFDRTGGYRTELLHAEDYDLWLRVAEISQMANLDRMLLYYRAHANQVSMLQAEQQVVSVVGAQLSAAARATGSADPIVRGRSVDLRHLVCATRAEPSRLSSRLIAAATTSAVHMIMNKECDRAVALLDWAESVSPPGPVPGRVTARLRLARAAAAWSQRQRGPAMWHGMAACSADLFTTVGTAWAGIRTLAGRLPGLGHM
jgi:glycosyl transferase family 2